MADATPLLRRRFDLRGQVQGVGFRPYVFRLAHARGLAGFVANDANGALIEVEGPAADVADFEAALIRELPPLARISDLRRTDLATRGELAFEIHSSHGDAALRPDVTPDAATCADCLRELRDPHDRRCGYAFINCTNCGPRYSIIRDVPYDRPQTTMAVFTMCAACAREYADPADRRFHAQPNACPACGPALEFRPVHGRGVLAGVSTGGPAAAEPISAAADLLLAGGIVAVKGLGGYHLACRADSEPTVRRLRDRKLRDGKPLAVMVPDLAAAERICVLAPTDRTALQSAAAPIVLAPQRPGHGLAPSVAPGCRDFGVMLAYAPVHHLLFSALAADAAALVMTSANLAGQPLTYRDADALAQLADVADALLLHNREIFRPIDDSVVFTFEPPSPNRADPNRARKEAAATAPSLIPIRRARGYAPQPIRLALDTPAPPILAVGGELKSAVCLLRGHAAIVSEHLGELAHPDAYRHFVHASDRLKQLFAFAPQLAACDLHPAYLSSAYARRLALPLVAVQHHHAHIASIMAEHGVRGPLIGLACDGTGYGPDGAIWGCEVLYCERGEFERLGHLEYYPLVGGDAAALETWRPAAALVRAAFGADWRRHWDALTELNARSSVAVESHSPASPDPGALAGLEPQIASRINTVPTSSLGRVFDAVAWLLGLCGRNRHEAEAAMAVEAAAARHTDPAEAFQHRIEPDRSAGRTSMVLSVAPLIRGLVSARLAGAPPELLAARFHETIARLLAAAADRACAARGVAQVGLSGGCFANRILLGRVVDLLAGAGRPALLHRQVPPGDGGLALGQAWVAAWCAAR
ncbi:MAG: carbamoyltransferase HypF [Planctomycetota bacterium]